MYLHPSLREMGTPRPLLNPLSKGWCIDWAPRSSSEFRTVAGKRRTFPALMYLQVHTRKAFHSFRANPDCTHSAWTQIFISPCLQRLLGSSTAYRPDHGNCPAARVHRHASPSTARYLYRPPGLERLNGLTCNIMDLCMSWTPRH